MLPPPTLSPAETLVDGKVQRLSTTRKLLLLLVFCLAQFLDSFNNSALFSAIPSLVISLDMTQSQSTWLISAFQLTFASFLLISGRISDVYNPKTAFITGIAGLGVISVGAGFVENKIGIIILRALMGIVAALTIPSALSLLVGTFPDPLEQARAIGVFGGCGAVANVLGLVIGAIFVEFASWHWVFWFVAIIAVPVAAACIFLIPPQRSITNGDQPKWAKFRSLDLVGVGLLTVALILFIFAITSASAAGWGTAMVLAPLIISIGMIVAFFWWETRIPPELAAIPPRTWFYKNFSVLFAIALMPYFWWSTVFSTFTTVWQSIYGWSVISSAIHMFPIGVMAFTMSFTGSLSRVFSPKWIILTGLSLCVISTILLAIGGGKEDGYWPYIFPAFAIGSSGAMLTFTHTNIAIFQAAPASMAGTVGAIFNGALQCGSAIGLAVISSIETSVEAKNGGPDSYSGREDAFWFILGIIVLQMIALLIFYRTDSDHLPQPKSENDRESTPEKEEYVDEKKSGEIDVELASLSVVPMDSLTKTVTETSDSLV